MKIREFDSPDKKTGGPPEVDWNQTKLFGHY